jgi:ABC-type amino acid transport substrate-binding protein
MNLPGRRMVVLGAAAVLAAAIAGIDLRGGAVRGAPEEIFQKVLRTHVLTVGTISGNPPWSITKPNGELDGYDIAIARLLGRDLGARVNFVVTSGAGRIPALQTQKVDIVLAELNYTPARSLAVTYTQVYSNPISQFLVPASSPYKTVQSLNEPNVTLGYALGGNEAQIWPVLLPKARLQAFTTVADAEQALLSGRVTATGETDILNRQLIQAHPGMLRAINPPYVKGYVGIGLPYGDFDWWLWLDRWVGYFNYSGQNQKLWTQYMGGGTPLVAEAPAGVRASAAAWAPQAWPPAGTGTVPGAPFGLVGPR